VLEQMLELAVGKNFPVAIAKGKRAFASVILPEGKY